MAPQAALDIHGRLERGAEGTRARPWSAGAPYAGDQIADAGEAVHLLVVADLDGEGVLDVEHDHGQVEPVDAEVAEACPAGDRIAEVAGVLGRGWR